MLELTDVSHSWGRGRPLLQGVDLKVESGQSVAIMGPSGSGKSTLLAILGGLLSPDGGGVSLDGRAVGSNRQRRWLTTRVGWVQQTSNVLGRRDVLGNVLVGLYRTSLRPRARRRAAEAALSEVGLSDYGPRIVSSLSGGEVQRVVIARALAAKPQLLLADEPTGQLDETTSASVAETLVTAARNQDCLVIIATHDPNVSLACDRRFVLSDGRLEPPTAQRSGSPCGP